MALKEKPESDRGGMPCTKPQFTDDGRPICFKCKGVGHIAKECSQRKPVNPSEAASVSPQGN